LDENEAAKAIFTMSTDRSAMAVDEGCLEGSADSSIAGQQYLEDSSPLAGLFTY
jgi:hypothetical protein